MSTTGYDAMKLKKMYMCERKWAFFSRKIAALLKYLILSFIARGGGEFFGPSGVVNSPEWPRPYSDFADSYLKITCDSGEKVELQFLSFDIEDHSSCQ